MTLAQAKDVRVGGTFIHPDGAVLRWGQLKNVSLEDGMPPWGENKGLAVDDEGGLYSLHPDNHVRVPPSMPLVTQPSDDHYVVIATFERQLSDDLPTMRCNFRRGTITADPDKDFDRAALQQLALEVQDAFDNGMGGSFQGHRVLRSRYYDREKMAWK